MSTAGPTSIRRRRRVGSVAAAAVIGALAAGAVAAPASAAPAPAPVVPVTIIFSDDGGYLPVVDVKINGSDTMRMMLDTGTNFMVTFPDAIQNPTTPIDNTDIPQGISYDGSAAAGSIALGTVTLGGVTTPAPVAFLDATSCTPQCLGYRDDLDGVIGIGQRLADAHNQGNPAYDLFSPLEQLGEGLNGGFSIDFTDPDSGNSTLTLGTPSAVPGDITLQRQQDAGKVYPGGHPVFLEPEICWTVAIGGELASACEDTVLDTGQSTGVVHGDQFERVVDPATAPPDPGSGIQLKGWVKTGAAVTWGASPTAPTFGGIIEPGTLPYTYGLFTDGGGKGDFNAGNGFYLRHKVGFDNITGAVHITPPAGAPDAPAAVHGGIDGTSVRVDWDAAAIAYAAGGGGPGGMAGMRLVAAAGGAPTAYVVTVTHRDTGARVAAQTMPASARSATFAGLAPGRYSVQVAAANTIAIGRALAVDVDLPDPAHPRLADSGAAAWWPAGVIGAAALLGGAALALRTRGRRIRSTSRPR